MRLNGIPYTGFSDCRCASRLDHREYKPDHPIQSLLAKYQCINHVAIGYFGPGYDQAGIGIYAYVCF
ncbi:hypothetical protein [Nitrosomonas sp.]|uniref:hypothetical protein n=1 Tax=Nitrosomonas sp. TaxID=42353 RepID=UPI0025E9B42E|nr:hypothetical protein [Nitrosomonas sp.]